MGYAMIEAYAFGRIQISGKAYTRDVKIIGRRVVPEWWRKNGHSVEADDIKDILDAGVDVLVLGQGDPGRMQSTPDLKQLLKEKQIKTIELPTRRAIAEFNRLIGQTENVAAGFHLTC